MTLGAKSEFPVSFWGVNVVIHKTWGWLLWEYFLILRLTPSAKSQN